MPVPTEESFNRSSAMWPTSTKTRNWDDGVFTGQFQSLKRNVAYFHVLTIVYFGLQFAFQSLKRDVAYFHPLLYPLPRLPHRRFNRSSAMWPTSTHIRRCTTFSHTDLVSIAQARCGLLPLKRSGRVE